MRNVHAQNTARHVTDDADEVATFIVKDANLVSSSSASNNKVLLFVEHSRVKHGWSLWLEFLHMLIVSL